MSLRSVQRNLEGPLAVQKIIYFLKAEREVFGCMKRVSNSSLDRVLFQCENSKTECSTKNRDKKRLNSLLMGTRRF
jgi:hypothetical protein